MRTASNDAQQAAVSPILAPDLRATTKLTGLRIVHWGPHHKYAGLAGTLTATQSTTGPLPHQSLTIYYQANSHTPWKQVATTATWSNGSFDFHLYGHPHGNYRVTFNATPDYQATSGPTITFTR